MSQELISTLLPIALIGFIGLLVGAVAGYLLASLSNQTGPQEPKRSKSLAELARVWLDRRSGKVTLEMDGKLIGSAAELSAEQKAALAKAVDELQLWLGSDEMMARALGGSPAASVAATGAAATGVATAPAAANGARASEALPEPSPAATAAAAAALLQPAEEVKPPSMEVRDIISSAFTFNRNKTGPQPVKSIAAQVDEIIQEKLPNSPFKNHLITMTELPGAGLVVKIDGARYDGVGDVPDPEIQAFLRECVAEWERRTENARS